ncbi:MAG: autotransporter outer membrane beta-barrel domain-containing protein [Fusobacteriaceae bacterium]
MRKKILLSLYPLIGICTFAFYSNNTAELNSKVVTEKGKQYMRLGILSSMLARAGTSRSTQNIEVYGGDGKFSGDGTYSGYDTRSEGFTIGTTSQFRNIKTDVVDSKWITGVSFGYIDSEVDYQEKSKKEEIGTIGVNAYLGYFRNNYFTMGYLGIGFSRAEILGKSQHREDVNFGIESGKIFHLGERQYIYPYLGLDFNGYLLSNYEIEDYEYKKGNEAQGTAGAGITYFIDYTKYLFKFNARWSSPLNENKKYEVINSSGDKMKLGKFNLEGDTLTLSALSGYYIAEDLLISLEVLGVYGKNYRETVYGMKLSYTF